ncbi:MAG: hypothetical protein EWV53_08835 [Microcystis panniformis Mp_MB_F_20051200_S9]|uniref:Uncharacterized protein n=1 Tax=Microcystis panniformis Mp_MB_F_20051200_S9 TaxID=2486223 RepID=A0A552Q257_9CHRO|nr:MAG: hypothetical protein EWV43_23945 [Microcystis panniformis Mp_MB_F_20080800_S26D]TRV45171.1 MAG: hypothetical protein EWV87_17940 [Microcystis panniformis Mp_GB_SS_20050300_S99]TRV55694.1 MAG: hypothetical protein EWV42_00985 [Microcystis panniformis Mp_GB_SS_20050300_S99D]TRV57304.1 MAG: hypothetical protein EWV69_16325 [Microcystis panniformis Mp_MB_F_20080800_S26]TRV60733.1 MAG: hypothetical protein EWV86_16100 [Microcystis panniformis Mp_MB_F_20051200_S9D]TRV63301.1 MAG: hypothetica
MGMVRSPKSIAGAVGATLGNAPYGDSVLLRSAFGIALPSITSHRSACIGIVMRYDLKPIIPSQTTRLHC